MSKPVYGKNAVQLNHNDRSTGVVWLLAAAFILFLGWAPFQRGLFNSQQLIFEKPLFVSALLCCLMLFGWVGLNYKNSSCRSKVTCLSWLHLCCRSFTRSHCL